ncbi:MAG: hypothetical protein IJR08_01505 [Bacilli bacterium]|nr:hypothetical protein [Bacilli bacterium]
MKKNKLKETIEFVGLSYKKELVIILVINVVFLLAAISIYIFIKNFILAIIALVGVAILDYFMFSRYNDKKKTILKNRENELVSIISYFDVYIRNNKNVYQSFNQLIPYCSNWMKEKIEDLLREIDEDKSIQPFVNFASNFQNLSMHSLMISIYQMVDQGESSDQLTHFNVIFDEIARNRQQEMITQKDKALSGMSTFPLIGAGMITIALTISILTILGDLINVI